MLVAPEARNPLLASSFGTGELIRHATDAGIRHIILGIGGSATVDGGMGVAQALGVRFLDAQGMLLGAGGAIYRAASIDLQGCDPRISECRIEVACDVDNPLVGQARRRYSVRRKGRRLKWSRRWKMDYVIMPVSYML